MDWIKSINECYYSLLGFLAGLWELANFAWNLSINISSSLWSWTDKISAISVKNFVSFRVDPVGSSVIKKLRKKKKIFFLKGIKNYKKKKKFFFQGNKKLWKKKNRSKIWNSSDSFPKVSSADILKQHKEICCGWKRKQRSVKRDFSNFSFAKSRIAFNCFCVICVFDNFCYN